MAPSIVRTSMTGLSGAEAVVVAPFAPRSSTAAQASSASRLARITSAPVLVQLNRLRPADLVLLVDEDDRRNVTQKLLALHDRVREDDHRVADVRETRGRAVQAYHARAPRAPDGVRVEPLPVVHVQDLHLLVREDIGRVHQLCVDRDRSLVIEIGLGDGGAVDLGLESGQAHASTASLTAA